MKYKVALIVGRFQPFHKGHLYLVKKALKKAEKIIFGIGSANIHDEYNPLNYDQRKKMLEMVIRKEKIEDRVLKIVPLDDVYNNEKWLKIVKEKAGQFDLVVSNSEWTNRILEKAGYKIWRLGYYRKDLYEGWRIRKLISEGKDFKRRIPTYLFPYLISNFNGFDSAHHCPERSRMDKFQISKQKSNHQFLKTNFQYLHSIIGGTFDRLHKGHEKFISQAFENSSRVTIGLTTEKMIKKKILWQNIESFDDRKITLIRFLKQKRYDKRAKIIPLNDIYGIGASKEKIDAIFVTEETYTGGLAINKLRQQKGWSDLQIEKVSYVIAQDGKKISSERIRLGEIDRQGYVYTNIFKNKKELTLPEDLREELRQPIGLVVTSLGTPGVPKIARTLRNATMVISVGDIISMELVKVGTEPDVKIIDFRSRRKKIFNDQFLIFNQFQISNLKFKITNNAGTISSQSIAAIKKTIDSFLATGKKQVIVVDGEEDLLALPAIMLAPLNSVVLYGQLEIGVVMNQVTEDMKKKVAKILLKFI